MATLGTIALTLADWGKRTENGKIAPIVEMLNQKNEVLTDMLWVQGNLPTGHKTTVRSGLPSATWRLLNYGVQPSKSRTVQVTDTVGMLEAYSEIDKSLADLNGNTADFRLSEDGPFTEAMNQQFVSTLFYGNTATDPEKFLGLAPRFNTVTLANANSADNVIDGGGTGSTNTSVWLVAWDATTITGIFPKGSTAGLNHTDLGEHTLFDANGGKYQGYRSHYKWDCGLTVRDWRYVVRIPNIDVTTLTKANTAGSDLIDLLTQALERVRDLTTGTPVFYVNRTVKSFLRRQISNKTLQSTLSMETIAGVPVMTFGGVPVRRVDALLSTEARVV